MLVIKLNSNNPRLFDGFKFINKKKSFIDRTRCKNINQQQKKKKEVW